ncbi:FAD-dependent thymidylate synthase [Mesorhizobium sp. STM 4661]|uniref:FAD-dependent thymidylate synthase n=1 Tax=Mesorhizobium sp. STM 4661 TaxID=1297570 RepID=UPI0002BD6B5C|nr:FAD-dependent thymidylate synthase [Mesorhizobium sp. STM 4661]CCV12897.1 Gp30 [Mesorhizobium sp. STM 4661]
MTIRATIVADSISDAGKRITTMQLRYPRFIHAEELTHRVLSTTPEEIVIQTIADGLMYDENLSRNASSSRAIPVNKLIQDVLDDTAKPIHWGKNQPGMQADEEHTAPVDVGLALGFHRVHEVSPQEAWLITRNQMVTMARAFDAAGYHKQIVNRLLEPFSHINVVVTATEWANFFGLRRHNGAQPEIHELADKMFDAMEYSKPVKLYEGQWHVPYVRDDDKDIWDYGLAHDLDLKPLAIKLSVARCARVSYLTHDGKKPDIASDLALYDRLVGSEPLHASPAEHQATPDKTFLRGSEPEFEQPNLHGNFIGWVQYRKTLPNENIQ